MDRNNNLRYILSDLELDGTKVRFKLGKSRVSLPKGLTDVTHVARALGNYVSVERLHEDGEIPLARNISKIMYEGEVVYDVKPFPNEEK